MSGGIVMSNSTHSPKISIIFPCYNEEHSLKTLIQKLNHFPQQYDVEFIIVENGSTDNSRTLLQHIHSPYIHQVYIDHNQGYGYGIIQGLKTAKGDYVGWMHSDLQYNPDDLTIFLDYLQKHSNDRLFLKGKRLNRTPLDKFFTFNMGIFDSILFGCKMSEIMSSPTIAPRSLFPRPDDLPLDFSIDIYTYVLAKQSQLKIIHLPIHLKRRKAGKSSWNSGLNSRIKMSRTLISDSLKIRRELRKKP